MTGLYIPKPFSWFGAGRGREREADGQGRWLRGGGGAAGGGCGAPQQIEKSWVFFAFASFKI